jgi:type I protein arginine methyltransferase
VSPQTARENNLDRQLAVRTRGGTPEPGAVYLCPSVGEYPVYDQAIYSVLRADQRRNSLFSAAVAAAASGATVLEIGCGPDLLWTLQAADAGAAHVYAVEVIEDAARLARQAARTRPDGTISVITGDSTRITLPQRADLCIAEIVGCIGGAEGIAAVLADTRRRHLVPSARVIPAAVRTKAAAVGLLDLLGGDAAMPVQFEPYVQAVFRKAGGPFDLRFYVGGIGPHALMSTTGTFEDLDLAGQSYIQGGDLRLQITADGRIDGLLAWIELAVTPGGEVLDSLAEDTNWLPVYIPFTRPEKLDVSVGDILSLNATARIAADSIHPEYFFRGGLTPAGARAPVVVSAESRYSGGPFRATAVHRQLFGA